MILSIVMMLLYAGFAFYLWQNFGQSKTARLFAIGFVLQTIASLFFMSMRIAQYFPDFLIYGVSAIDSVGLGLLVCAFVSLLPRFKDELHGTPQKPTMLDVIGIMMMVGGVIGYLVVFGVGVVGNISPQYHPLLTLATISSTMSLAFGWGIKNGIPAARAMYLAITPFLILLSFWLGGVEPNSITGAGAYLVGAYFLTRAPANAYFNREVRPA